MKLIYRLVIHPTFAGSPPGKLVLFYSSAAAFSLSMSASETLSFFRSMTDSAFSTDCSRELTAPFSFTSSPLGVPSFDALDSTSFSGDLAFSTDISRSAELSFSDADSFSTELSLAGVPSLDLGVASLAGVLSFAGVGSREADPALDLGVLSLAGVLSLDLGVPSLAGVPSLDLAGVLSLAGVPSFELFTTSRSCDVSFDCVPDAVPLRACNGVSKN